MPSYPPARPPQPPPPPGSITTNSSTSTSTSTSSSRSCRDWLFQCSGRNRRSSVPVPITAPKPVHKHPPPPPLPGPNARPTSAPLASTGTSVSTPTPTSTTTSTALSHSTTRSGVMKHHVSPTSKHHHDIPSKTRSMTYTPEHSMQRIASEASGISFAINVIPPTPKNVTAAKAPIRQPSLSVTRTRPPVEDN